MTTRQWVAACIAAFFCACTAWADPLPKTKPLVIDQPLDVIMVDGIGRFALRELADSADRRGKLWNRDCSTRAAYEKRIEPNRQHPRSLSRAAGQRRRRRAIY